MKITGTDDDDVLNGTDQIDTIRGLGGDDTIYSNGGADLIFGGAGDDMIYLRQSAAFAYAEDGDDTFVPQELTLSATRTLVDGGDGIDTFDASAITALGDLNPNFFWDQDSGRLYVGGYALADIEVIRGPDFGEVDYDLGDWATAMTIYGGTGNDIVTSSRTAAVIFKGGDGDDVVYLHATGTRAGGGAGSDLFILDAFAGITRLRLDGDAGDDLISVKADHVDLRLDRVESNEGVRYAIRSVEQVEVSDVHDGGTITGNDAANILSVRSTSTTDRITIEGLGGDDLINGTFGDDTIRGGDGDDFVTGFTGFDTIEGGAGNDFASFGASDGGPLRVRLSVDGTTAVNAGDTVIAKMTSVEGIGGSQLSDVLSGNTLDNTLVGNGGDDRLLGGGGDDILEGGAGRDLLVGGAGPDRFVFRSYTDSNVDRAKADTIQDFRQADGDWIALDFDANVSAPGDQHFTFIGQNAFSGQAGEVRFDIVGKTTFVSVNIFGGHAADFTITLVGAVELTAGDFVL